jgi:hypothetical protein
VLAPVSSFAGEKLLFDLAGDMVTLAEATISCASSHGACTEADAIALKADAENGLRDIAGVVRAGNLNSMQLSINQTVSLNSRLKLLKSRLAQSGLFQNTCNAGVILLAQSLSLMSSLVAEIIIAILLHTPVNLVYEIVLLVAGIALLPVACLVLLTCLFWWL